MLLIWLKDDYQNAVNAAVVEACEEADVNLLTFATGILQSPVQFHTQRNRLFDLVSRERIDGLLLLSGTLVNHVGPRALATFCERFQPLPMVSVATVLPKIPSLSVDNTSGMRDVITHILAVHRKRRVAFLRGPVASEEAQLRFGVFRNCLAQHNVPYYDSLIVTGDFQRAAGVEAVRTLLDVRKESFDAIIAANDYMAIGAISELTRRGIRVPEDVAVAGFDDVDEARFCNPPLCTARQPLHEQGHRAVQMLLERMCGKSLPAIYTLRTELVIRASCGCTDRSSTSMPPELAKHAGSASAVLAYARDSLLENAHNALASTAREPASTVEHLVDALIADVGCNGTSTLDTLRKILPHSSDPLAWQAVLSSMLRETRSLLLHDRLALSHVQELTQLARVLVGDWGERRQAQTRLAVERWARIIAETSEVLHTTIDLASMLDVLCSVFPALQIPRCFLALWQDPSAATSEARLVLAYDPSTRTEARCDELFPAARLAPDHVFPQAERTTFVIQALFVRDEPLGFIALQMGPLAGMVYEALRDQISGALKGIQLVARLVEEATRRQEAERQRLAKEMEIAARIQTSILPRKLRMAGLDIAATMLPATEVGGDYFDLLPANDGRDGCWLGIGDVAGHGLQTGLVMLMVQSIVSTMVRSNPSAQPGEVLKVLNEVLYENVRDRLERDEHATLSLLRLYPNGRLVFAGAHEDIIILRQGATACELVPTPGPWIAARRNIARAIIDSEYTLAPGDLMVLYTDGITEAQNADGEQFGLDRLCDAIVAMANESAESICQHLLQTARAFMCEQVDDMTLMVVRYLPESTVWP